MFRHFLLMLKSGKGFLWVSIQLNVKTSASAWQSISYKAVSIHMIEKIHVSHLSQHIQTMSLVQPPKLTMLLMDPWSLITISHESRFSELIQTVHLVSCIGSCDICIITHTPKVILKLSYQLWVFSEFHDILARDGEDRDVFEGLPHLFGDGVSFLETTPTHDAGGPYSAVGCGFVLANWHGFDERGFENQYVES
jgi:hypothetical protein